MYYGQRQEDRKVVELLGMLPNGDAQKTDGFYIDIGAWDPECDSVTKHFYDRGWYGINVEPMPMYYQKLIEARPRDINLPLAITDDTAKPLIFYGMPGTGISTLRKDFADEWRASGTLIKEQTVSKCRLDDLCRIFIPVTVEDVDFLKVDVEGWEYQVLHSMNWALYRPKIVVVEATKPGTSDESAIPMWGDWEPLLLGVGYKFVHYDGLNRFYIDKSRLT